MMAFRANVVASANPRTLIDTDGWALPNIASYEAWTAHQGTLGVPSLYYVDRLDTADPKDRRIPTTLLTATAEHWSRYRAGLCDRAHP
ncbi:hypothetical protein [Actinomyces oricola]|uniref:hypothetical protein n=1 Tax=Actinomyces oricola TaxID=206043 RepID=UPI000FFF639A|nr:hypothetical protein [Actinomyces oricola]